MLDSRLQEMWCHLPPFVKWTQSSPPSVPPHSDHPLWCHPPLLRLSSYLPLRSLISPSPTSGSSYFPLSNPAKTKWIEEDSNSLKQWHEETARPKPWVAHTILVTLSMLSDFIKKMGQFDKNSGVISLFRSLINPFTFKNDEFQFYLQKNDEFHENAHFLSKK